MNATPLRLGQCWQYDTQGLRVGYGYVGYIAEGLANSFVDGGGDVIDGCSLRVGGLEGRKHAQPQTRHSNWW